MGGIREHPILFKAPMVRAVLDGSKTQTRRVVKWKLREPGLNLQFSGLQAGAYANGDPKTGYVLRSRGAGGCWNDRTYPIHCPYGQPGDRLWVREAFALQARGGRFDLPAFESEAWLDDGTVELAYGAYLYHRATDGDAVRGRFKPEAVKWRPSIHMPRWASRITLQVADVRVERIQDISEADARAEGIELGRGHHRPIHLPSGRVTTVALGSKRPYAMLFAALWDAINGKRDGGAYAWDANPWVWVVTFERLGVA